MQRHKQRGVRWLMAALVLAGVGGCVSAKQKPAPAAYELEPWKYGRLGGQKLTTAHYEVYTTISDSALVEAFPQLIERAYEYYQELVPPGRETDQRMRVYLFATRGQWAAFTERFTGPRASTFLKVRNGGYSERGVSVIQYVAHRVTFPLLAHEGFHQYLHFCVNPAVPAWINEGLAVVCEGQKWTTSGLERFDPWYNPTRREQLAEAILRNRLFPLKELLTTDAGNVIQETSARVATYYAQVWALVLFLREGENGKYAGGFKNLLAALGSDDLERRMQAESAFQEGARVSAGEALFRAFISDDVDTCEREYVAFMRKRMFGER